MGSSYYWSGGDRPTGCIHRTLVHHRRLGATRVAPAGNRARP